MRRQLVGFASNDHSSERLFRTKVPIAVRQCMTVSCAETDGHRTAENRHERLNPDLR